MTWFRGPTGEREGRLSLGYNALDRHVIAGAAGEPALLAPDGGSWDFARLLEEASALGGAFDALGVRPGAPVLVALNDPVDELVAVLACARLGAVAHLADSATDGLADAVDAARPVLMASSTTTEFAEHTPATVLLRDAEPVDPVRDLDWEVALRAGRTQGSAVAERAADDPAYVVGGLAVGVAEAPRSPDRVGAWFAALVGGRPVDLTATDEQKEATP